MWITYKVVAESNHEFTHFSRLDTLTEAQAEWEQKFSQRALSIELDDDEFDPDWLELLEEEQ